MSKSVAENRHERRSAGDDSRAIVKNGWQRKRVSEIAQHSLGKMLDKRKNKGEPKPYLRNINVRWFEFDLSDVLEMRFLPEETAKYTAIKGDLLICEGGYPGRAAIWDRDESIYFQKAIHRVRFHQPDHNKWFLYYLLTCDLDGTLRNHFTGSGIQHFTGQALAQFTVPLAPLAEQRRIVGILDEAFAGIATAKANAEKNLQNARALFESHLNAVFTQRGDDWVDTTVGEACENLDSMRVPITKSKRTAGKYPYYGASGIVDYVDDYIFDEDILLVSEDGANLLARTYPIAFSVSGKVWVNNHAHVLRCPSMASQRFMEFYLNSIRLDPYVSGMAQPKLNQKSLNSIPLPLPPLPQRKAIVANLDSLQDESQRLESIYHRKLASLDELKKSLLHQAFSGKL